MSKTNELIGISRYVYDESSVVYSFVFVGHIHHNDFMGIMWHQKHFCSADELNPPHLSIVDKQPSLRSADEVDTL